MAHVAKISTLRELDLPMTSVSDRGLALLQSLTALRRLELCLTRVTRRGIAAFRRAVLEREVHSHCAE